MSIKQDSGCEAFSTVCSSINWSFKKLPVEKSKSWLGMAVVKAIDECWARFSTQQWISEQIGAGIQIRRDQQATKAQGIN